MLKFKYRIRTLLLLTTIVALLVVPAVDLVSSWWSLKTPSRMVTVPDGGAVIIGGLDLRVLGGEKSHIDQSNRIRWSDAEPFTDSKSRLSVTVTPRIIIQQEKEGKVIGVFDDE